MNPIQAMQLAMKEKEMQELIKELIQYRSKEGTEKFNEKIVLMRLLLDDKIIEEVHIE
jgi:hypothetical protein